MLEAVDNRDQAIPIDVCWVSKPVEKIHHKQVCKPCIDADRTVDLLDSGLKLYGRAHAQIEVCGTHKNKSRYRRSVCEIKYASVTLAEHQNANLDTRNRADPTNDGCRR